VTKDNEHSIEERLENALLRQGERSGASPVIVGGTDIDSQSSLYTDDSPNKSWPMVIYILPNGDTLCRRELVHSEGSPFGSPHLAARSAIVLKIHPEALPGNSNGGAPMRAEVLKFRGDAAEFMKSLTLGFFATPGNEEDLIRKMFPPVAGEDDDDDPSTHDIGCTCIMCIPGG
jgi:hypothetical protein